MGNINLNVEIETIDTTKKLMEEKYNELLDEFNNYKMMIENSQDIYDTESATIYRDIGMQYIDIGVKYLNNDLKPYIDALDTIKQIYTETHERLSNSTGGK